jgi:pimeloyl-ACP methyl ester carboxylesterase
MRAKHLRKYGKQPFSVAVVHGGPGAAGEMAPVARKLAIGHGVLEPLQTGLTVGEQVEELKEALLKSARLPVTLIGFSWGAWLSFIFAATYPELVKKLILVGSGGYEEKYGRKTHQARMARFSSQEKLEFKALENLLGNHKAKDKDVIVAKLGALFTKIDTYDPLPQGKGKVEKVSCSADIFKSVWKDAQDLRASGKLLELGRNIRCPVVAIHGDYDPHPAQGVEKPLLRVLKKFRFILLTNCGHKPWIEREAKKRFFDILKEELV